MHAGACGSAVVSVTFRYNEVSLQHSLQHCRLPPSRCPHRPPSASDRLSTIVEEVKTEVVSCSDSFSFFSVLILCHLTSLILLPTQRRAPTANEQAMVCSVSRSTHGRRHTRVYYNWTWKLDDVQVLFIFSHPTHV